MGKGCVIVTGASRGIGAAIAHELAAQGYAVGCLSRTAELPESSGEAPAATGQRFFTARCDVTDAAQVARAIAEVEQQSGEPMIGLVNNAGIHKEGPSEAFAVDDFRHIMEVDAVAVFGACQAAFARLAANRGLIVNIGSFYDRLGVKRNAAYCAAKAAVGAVSRCLAVEWAKHGIRVLNVAPGYIVTDFNRDALENGPLAGYLAKRIPVGKPGQTRDVGRLVASLFALDAPFMTGETLYIDGGQGIAA